MADDAGRVAVGLELPEMPFARAVAHRWMMLGRAHPDRIIAERAVRQDRLKEVDAGVDYRATPVMALHFLEHDLHVGDRRFALEMAMAGLRSRRRLDIEHRRQAVVFDRHVLLEPGHFLAGRAAPINKMIGAVRDADAFGA